MVDGKGAGYFLFGCRWKVRSEALQSVAINLYFERKEIDEISFPFALMRWDANEWRATVDAGGAKQP